MSSLTVYSSIHIYPYFDSMYYVMLYLKHIVPLTKAFSFFPLNFCSNIVTNYLTLLTVFCLFQSLYFQDGSEQYNCGMFLSFKFKI